MLRYLLLLYKKVHSFFTRPCCRFSPTCSDYAVDAIERFGLVHGGKLALLRLIRCNQWFRGGFDPVPAK